MLNKTSQKFIAKKITTCDLDVLRQLKTNHLLDLDGNALTRPAGHDGKQGSAGPVGVEGPREVAHAELTFVDNIIPTIITQEDHFAPVLGLVQTGPTCLFDVLQPAGFRYTGVQTIKVIVNGSWSWETVVAGAVPCTLAVALNDVILQNDQTNTQISDQTRNASTVFTVELRTGDELRLYARNAGDDGNLLFKTMHFIVTSFCVNGST